MFYTYLHLNLLNGARIFGAYEGRISSLPKMNYLEWKQDQSFFFGGGGLTEGLVNLPEVTVEWAIGLND